MSDTFLSALRTEIDDLERELLSDSRYRKLTQLRKVLAEYDGAGALQADRRPEAKPLQPHHSRPASQSQARADALHMARDYLIAVGGPSPTREIYDALVSKGVKIAGKSPINNLSAMLSNSDDFHSNGRAGWTLTPPHSDPDPRETEAVAEALGDQDVPDEDDQSGGNVTGISSFR